MSQGVQKKVCYEAVLIQRIWAGCMMRKTGEGEVDYGASSYASRLTPRVEKGGGLSAL